MTPEALTPENTTVVLIDYAVGFVNNLRSHNTADHLNKRCRPGEDRCLV